MSGLFLQIALMDSGDAAGILAFILSEYPTACCGDESLERY